MQEEISGNSSVETHEEVSRMPQNPLKRPIGASIVTWILIVASVLSLLSTFLAASSPDYNAMLAKNRLPVTIQKISGLLGLLVLFVSALFMRDGVAWARWLFLGYSVLGFVVTIVNMGFTLKVLVGLLVYVVFAVLLLEKNSSAFFGDKQKMAAPCGMRSSHTYMLTIYCLILGLAMGYSLWGGSKASITTQVNAGDTNQSSSSTSSNEFVENSAKPFLEALNKNPNDFTTIVKLANLYHDTQKYPEAMQYYGQALKIHPEDPDVRTDLGNVYFLIGDADLAITAYLTALHYQPNHVNALYNLGLVRWRGKVDASGAIAAWEELLQRNPNLPERQHIEELIALVRSGKKLN
jgi:cytochrome c-type biogenesis protein CcmH/NrfG